MEKVRFAAPLLAVLIIATTGQTPPPSQPPDVRVAFLTPPYVIAGSCDLKQLAILRTLVTNPGGTATPPFVLEAFDERVMLEGNSPAPALPPGGIAQVDISLRQRGFARPEQLAGTHRITVDARNRVSPIEVNLLFPAALCGPSKPGVTTGTTATRGPSLTAIKPAVTSATKGPSLTAMSTPAAPTNLHAVLDKKDDCAPHVGLLGALVCPDMMKSGDLLLIWDFQPGNGADIDGYRLYRVFSTPQLIATRTNGAQTLYDVPKPPNGRYDGNCYVVTAYAGKFESRPSNEFCAGARSAARTTTFTPVHQLSVSRHTFNRHELAPTHRADAASNRVGFSYEARQGGIQDSSFTWITRYAMLFDVQPLLGRKVVEAHLTLNALPPSSGGLNCANSVGIGTEDWWTAGRWPDGSFSSGSLTLIGNVLRIDLTNPVQNWMNGRFNQGVILRNDDENLNAFISKRCETDYTSPVLSITYY